jgi:AraC-like DNA-binding protein
MSFAHGEYDQKGVADQLNAFRISRDRWTRPRGTHAVAAPLPHAEIVSYIRANLTRRITLDEIADLAQLSVFQLVRAFRRESETTPYRLIVDLRIEHATALLARGDSIADAAYCAGFADQSHFTRHFRRRTGFTPKRYLTATKVAA